MPPRWRKPKTPKQVDRVALLKELGRRVRERREAMSVSQEELGKAAGLHRNYIGGIEQGTRNVAMVNLTKLALALDVTLAELVDELT